MAAYSWSWLSLPYVVFTGLLVFALGCVLFTRGNPLIRIALGLVVVCAAPWAVAVMLAGSCTDPQLVEHLLRIGGAPVPIVGPALMLLFLALANRVQRHLGLLVFAFVLAAVSTVVAATTPWVVAGHWQTRLGMPWSVGGPLLEAHVGQIALWALVGMVLAARGTPRGRSKQHYRRLAGLALMVIVSCGDSLLSRKIGVYPLSWLTGSVATCIALHAHFRHDLMHATGFDRAMAVEVGVLAVLAAGVYAVAEVATGLGSPSVAVGAALPLFALAQLAALGARRYRPRPQPRAQGAARALEAFAEAAATVRHETELEGPVREVLEVMLGLTAPRLLLADPNGLKALDGTTHALDPRVLAWLKTNRQPLVVEHLSAQRLGGLREPIEAFLEATEADHLVPLVDRDELLGVIVTGARRDDRALDDADLLALARVQEAAARTLTVVRLTREAEAQLEVEREVEVAAAVQRTVATGDQILAYEGCEIASTYVPASRFAGDWWSSYEVTDGRVLVVIGDATAHGIPTALLTSAVAGSCDTAQRMLGAGLDLLSLLEILNRVVRDVGKSRYAMSCFAALFDAARRVVTFANAGHPFPYVCRAARPGSRHAVELRSLVSRGTPLGAEVRPILSAASFELAPEDLVLFYTRALVESSDAQGRPWGERRLQRTLRAHALGAGKRICRVVVDEARRHYGDRPPVDDITLVAVRLVR